VIPFEPDAPPRLEGTPVLIGAGRNDPIAPPALAQRLAELLRDAGAEVTLEWDGGGHSIGPGQVEAARAWLERTALRRSTS
jgi:predicted esterase